MAGNASRIGQMLEFMDVLEEEHQRQQAQRVHAKDHAGEKSSDMKGSNVTMKLSNLTCRQVPAVCDCAFTWTQEK
jgi:hypothetical protein